MKWFYYIIHALNCRIIKRSQAFHDISKTILRLHGVFPIETCHSMQLVLRAQKQVCPVRCVWHV